VTSTSDRMPRSAALGVNCSSLFIRVKVCQRGWVCPHAWDNERRALACVQVTPLCEAASLGKGPRVALSPDIRIFLLPHRTHVWRPLPETVSPNRTFSP
jgi:hypothetical protein